jgi:hypothetical protein
LFIQHLLFRYSAANYFSTINKQAFDCFCVTLIPVSVMLLQVRLQEKLDTKGSPGATSGDECRFKVQKTPVISHVSSPII